MFIFTWIDESISIGEESEIETLDILRKNLRELESIDDNIATQINPVSGEHRNIEEYIVPYDHRTSDELSHLI